MSLDCHVDLDSLWMVYWEDRRNVETGSRTGVYDWRSVPCCVALLSRLPEFPDTDCLNCFRDVGKNCVLDLNARRTYTALGRLSAVWRRLLRCRLFSIARGIDIPRAKHRLRGKWMFPRARWSARKTWAI